MAHSTWRTAHGSQHMPRHCPPRARRPSTSTLASSAARATPQPQATTAQTYPSASQQSLLLPFRLAACDTMASTTTRSLCSEPLASVTMVPTSSCISEANIKKRFQNTWCGESGRLGEDAMLRTRMEDPRYRHDPSTGDHADGLHDRALHAPRNCRLSWDAVVCLRTWHTGYLRMLWDC